MFRNQFHSLPIKIYLWSAEHWKDVLEECLDDALIQDFNIECEDGSQSEVAQAMIDLYESIMQGKVSKDGEGGVLCIDNRTYERSIMFHVFLFFSSFFIIISFRATGLLVGAAKECC